MKRIDTVNRQNAEIGPREEILQMAKDCHPSLATTFDDLLGDGGPPEETADQMIRAITEWREFPSTRSLA